MNPFPQPLHYDNAGFINGERWIVLTEDFPCITSMGRIITPRGFVCNGGSVPRIAQSIVGHPFDVFLEDCIPHDFLYSPLNTEYHRDEADLILKETMWNRRDQVSAFKREALYRAVRWFGASSFKAKLP